MKRLGMLLMACAFVLGMSQCKKEETPSVNNEKIHITFSASCGQDGAKTDFYPGSGFSWPTSGVMEYVNVGGSLSGYLGQLSSNGQNEFDTDTERNFSGSITTPQDGETLYFFYLGKGDHAGATSINFADQTGILTDVTNKHIAIGSCTYYEGDDSFGATLLMSMAIACFNTEDFVDDFGLPETVYLYGDDIYSSAAIDYRTGKITGITKNYICTGKASEECYVALIPDDDDDPYQESTQINFVSKSHSGSIYFDGIIAPRWFYAHQGGELGLEVEIDPYESGFESYTFSVSATQKVQFSKGNLQYQPSTGTWRFAEHQYDMGFAIASEGVVYQIYDEDEDETTNLTAEEYYAYDGDDCNSLNIAVSSHYTSTSTAYIDMFGWGAWEEGNVPYNTSSTYNCTNNFHVDIDGSNDWRILSNEEWTYLLSRRDGPDKKWGIAKVNGVRGIVLLPDLWALPSGLTFKTGYLYGDNVDSETQWEYNTYNTEQWTLMEENGAMFLPAAGWRSGTNIHVAACWGAEGHYWTSDQSSLLNTSAINFYFQADGVTTSSMRKNRGASVRLVRDAN